MNNVPILKERRIVSPSNWDTEITYISLVAFYNALLDISVRNLDDSDFILLHHRKSTYGSTNLSNVHPFVGEKFVLLQNGSSKAIHNWWKIEFIGETDKTDSYYILKYLEKHNATSLNEAQELLNQIAGTSWEDLGVIVLVDKQTNQILFYMDWARSLYIELENETKVNYISSLKQGVYTEYFNEGYLIIDFEWNIIENWMDWLLNYSKTTYVTETRASNNAEWENYYKNNSYSKKKEEDEDEVTIWNVGKSRQTYLPTKTKWLDTNWTTAFTNVDEICEYIETTEKRINSIQYYFEKKEFYLKSSLTKAIKQLQDFCDWNILLAKDTSIDERREISIQLTNKEITAEECVLEHKKISETLNTNVTYETEILKYYIDIYERIRKQIY